MEKEVWIAWRDGCCEEAVEFEVPLNGKPFDIAEAGAKALKIDVCPELNVKQIK